MINDYYAMDIHAFLILGVSACSITQHGNRVTVHWDQLRMIRGEENFNQNVVSGLLSSLCIVPILSYGAMAPLAAMPKDRWAEKPLDLPHLEGTEDDREDALLKVWCSQIPTDYLESKMICDVLLIGTARCRNPARVCEGRERA